MNTFTFEFEDFQIYGDEGEFPIDGEECKTVLCEIDVVMTEPPTPGISPSLNDPGEPPWPGQFEIHEVRLTDVPYGDQLSDKHTKLVLTETQFVVFFSNGQDICNCAFEWAAEQEVEYDDR